MKVKDLKAALERYPDDMEVVMTRGRESEHASVLYHVSAMLYVPHSKQHGYVFAFPEEETLGPQAILVVILRPAQ